MEEHRKKELRTAIEGYYKELENLAMQRMEISRQEMEAWQALRIILCLDNPEMLSPYFKRYLDEFYED